MAQFPNTTAADGIWTLKKVRRAILGDNWPEVVVADEFFANTVLLLQADDFADGSQNNTFLDSSTNTHTITRNGNVTQGSFSPFSQDEGKWGVYFDGSGDTLLAPANQSSLDPGSADFTVEGWFNLEDTGTSQTLMIYANPNGSTSNASATAFAVQLQSDQIVRMFAYTGSTAGGAASTTATLNFGEWYHLAMTRSGTTFTLYINGVSSATMTVSGALNADTGRRFYIGNYLNGYAARWIKGYASNVRYVPGTALYASNFTPSTEPLTAVSGTGVLLCQDNRFNDNSTNDFTLSTTGTPEVTPFSPFAPSTAYDPATKGGSGYFDGSGDYLSIPDSPVWDLGSGDWTIDFWVYLNSTANQNLVSYQWENTSASGRILAIYINNSQWIFLTRITTGHVATPVIPHQWNHVRLVRSGATTYGFINGKLESTGSALNYGTSSYGIQLGCSFSGATPVSFLNGYMSDVRIIRGVGLTTTDFTLPAAPVTSDANTTLLCNFTNAGIYDGTGRNVLETVGDAQVDTAVKKYGTGSMQFDGTGDYLSLPASEQLAFGTGDFTIEFWVNPTSLANNPMIYAHVNSTIGSSIGWFVELGSAGQVYFGPGNSANTFLESSSGAVSSGSWTHVACTRVGELLTIYADGISVGSATKSNADLSYDRTENAQIGRFFTSTSYDYTGYIDDLRITKGVARYTANFTPPAAVLPKQ